jgi:hypothetical protein
MSTMDAVLKDLPAGVIVDWAGDYSADLSAGKRDKAAAVYRGSPTEQIEVVTYHYNDPEKPLHNVKREYWANTPEAAHKLLEDFLLG